MWIVITLSKNEDIAGIGQTIKLTGQMGTCHEILETACDDSPQGGPIQTMVSVVGSEILRQNFRQ